MRIIYLYAKMTPKNQDSSTFFAGGAQKRVYQMAVYFANKDHCVLLGSDDNDDTLIIQDLKKQKVNHISIPFRGSLFQNFTAFFCLLKTIKKEKIEIIHCNDRKTALFGYIISILTKRKMVYTARNTFKDKIYTKLFLGNNIVAVSLGVKNNLIQKFNIKKEKIAVIYNGTDIKHSTSEEVSHLRTKYNLSENKRIITFVGRLSEQKGLFYLLDAINIVKIHFPEVIILFVGDGELRLALEKKTVELSLNENIIFCGNQKNVQPYYDICDFTVMSSLWEGLPGSGIESIMLGKPLIGTKVGGIPEIVLNGKNGFLVSPGDSEQLAQKIIELLLNPQLVYSMGKECLKVAAANFTLSQMLINYEKYYLKLYDK